MLHLQATTQDDMMTDTLLTDREVAAILGCSRSSLWRWAADGTVPRPLRIGGMSRWRQSDIKGLIDQAAEARKVA